MMLFALVAVAGFFFLQWASTTGGSLRGGMVFGRHGTAEARLTVSGPSVVTQVATAAAMAAKGVVMEMAAVLVCRYSAVTLH